MEDHGSSRPQSDARDAKSQLLPSEVLSRAADLIEPEGKWLQGAFAADVNGTTTEDDPDLVPVCFCLFGAVNVASGLAADADEPRRDVDRFLVAAIGLPERTVPSDVADWNDDADRAQAEVIAALRKAADLARSEGQ